MGNGKRMCAWFNERLGRAKGCEVARSKTDRMPRLCYGFGALTSIVLLLVGLSGAYMAMFYQASPAEAWKSVVFIENRVALGHFARSLHRWGAFLSLIFVILHIIQAIYRGAYRAPRELVWFSGIALLILTICFAVTGYMLPWDFKSYWVVKTITNWLETLPLFPGLLNWFMYTDAPNGQVPIGRWFAMHIMVLPMLTGAVLGGHYLIFRRHGSAKVEKGGDAHDF